MIYVDVHTFYSASGEDRTVSLAFSPKTGEITLLGNLEHGARIVVDQKLVDDLQHLVNLSKEGKDVQL